MTTYLILVKHSVPQVEVDHPASTWKLSAEGQIRARRLAEELASFAPDAIVSSNQPKAKETAKILAGQLQLDLKIFPELHEHDRNNVPFLPHDAFESSILEFFQKPGELVF